MFYSEGGETLTQVAQRGGRCPVPGNVPGQAGRGSEQPDRVGDVPAHCRDRLGWMGSKGPSNPKHSVIPMKLHRIEMCGYKVDWHF